MQKTIDWYFTDNREKIEKFTIDLFGPKADILGSWSIEYTEIQTGVGKSQNFGYKDGKPAYSRPLIFEKKWLTQIDCYVDLKDIEGFRFHFDDGSSRDLSADKNLQPLDDPDNTIKLERKEVKLLGRPVGLKAIFGYNGKDEASSLTQYQPLQVQIYYNSCMCPISYFIQQADIADMENTAMIDNEKSAQIPQQFDKVGQLYGQDCGQYEVIIEPQKTFIEVRSSSTGLYDQDSLVLLPTKHADVGVHNLKLTVQSKGGIGYTQPSPGGVLTPIVYEFKVTVRPCQLVNIIQSADQVIEYEISSQSKSAQPYSFGQDPAACLHDESTAYSVQPNQPSWLTLDPTTNTFTINKFDDGKGFSPRYIIAIVHSVDDKSPTTPKRAQVQITINIVEKCTLSSIEIVKSIASSVEYTLGQVPILSTLPFQFELKVSEPRCTNFQIDDYKLTGVPNMITLDKVNQNINVAKSFQLDQRGTFENAQITAIVLDDRTGQKLNKLIEFTVIVNACPINNFSAIPTDLGTQKYTIGDNGFSFGYSLVQDLACGYDMEVNLIHTTNQPDSASFAFDKTVPNQQFTITKTEELNFIGTYKMKVEAKLLVPSVLSPKPQPIYIDLILEVVHPCTKTILDAFTIDDMITTVLAVPGNVQDLVSKKPQDSVSKVYGVQKDGLSYCGERLFRINSSSHMQYLSSLDAQNQVLTLLSKDDSDIRTYEEITIEVYLVNYPQVRKEGKFFVTIHSCQIYSFTAQTTPLYQYSLTKPATVSTIQIVDFKREPACSNGIIYEFKLINSSTKARENLPAFIQQDSSDSRKLIITTEDINDVGSYQIFVSGSAQFLGQQTTKFELKVIPIACEEEVVSPSNSIAPLRYIINSDIAPIKFNWNSNVSTFECPSLFKIYQRDTSGAWLAPISAQYSSTVKFNDIQGYLEVNSFDYSLDGQTWQLQLTKQSIYSNMAQTGASGPLGIHYITIDFVDPCYDAVLIPPAFDDSKVAMLLFNQLDFLFTNGKVNINCGGTIQELVYMGGPLLTKTFDLKNYLQVASDSNPDKSKVQGDLNSRIWVGTHTLIIRATNGQFDAGPNARGTNGLFKSIDSQSLVITVTDPCDNTIVNDDGSFQLGNKISVTEGNSSLSMIKKGPSDKVSHNYAPTQFDFCGPMQYDLRFIDDLWPSNFAFDVQLFNKGADELSLDLSSEEYGLEIIFPATLTISLINYPDSQPAVFSTIIAYRECIPSSFVVPFVKDQSFELGEPNIDLHVKFYQAPCSYMQTYTAVIVDEWSGETYPLPHFIKLDFEAAILTIETTQRGDEGIYQVQITSQIMNYARSQLTMTFQVEVLLPRRDDFGFDFPQSPFWEAQLAPQSMINGENLEYRPTLQVIENGYNYTLKVRLNRLQNLALYLPETNTIFVDGSKMNEQDIGTYSIVFIAEFRKNSELIRKQAVLTIMIRPSNTSPDPIDPFEDDKEYQDWNEQPQANLVPNQKVDDGAPVPHIVSLSDTGMLRIEWDTEMIIPSNRDLIPQKQIAVQDWSAFDQEDMDARLEIDYRSIISQNERQLEVLGQKPPDLLALISALEIRLLYQDEELVEPQVTQIELTKTIFKQTDRKMDIQLNITRPELIGSTGLPDTISVTFWDTKLFENTDNRQVRYGTELTTPIFRQISPLEAEYIDEMIKTWWPPIFCIICISMVGAQLPTWMFINSLSLIVHTTLLNSLMPSSVSYVFKQYLYVLRMSWPSLSQYIQDSEYFDDYASDEGHYSHYLRQNGYFHLFANNLVVIIVAILAIIQVWITLAVVDKFNSCIKIKNDIEIKTTRNEPLLNNFALRLFYELLFEFCICALVNISITDFDYTDISWQWVVSIAVCTLVVVYTIWIISLFCFNGPYLKGFYTKGTSWSSSWKARPISQNFNAIGKAESLEQTRKVLQREALKRLNKPKQVCKTTRVTPMEEKFGTPRPLLQAKSTLIENFVDQDLPTYRHFQFQDSTVESIERPTAPLIQQEAPTSILPEILGQPLRQMQTKMIIDSLMRQESLQKKADERRLHGKRASTSLLIQEITDQQDRSMIKSQTQQFEIQDEDELLEGGEAVSAQLIRRTGYSEVVKKNAKEIVAGITLTRRPARFNTLYLGLKLNHPRNVAIMHPLMFTIRRIVYALSIVWLYSMPLIGSWIMLAGTMLMLAYALTELQWRSKLINSQHIFNEVITYSICVYLLLFTNFLAASTRVRLGYSLLALFSSFIGFNTLIMLIVLCHKMLVSLKRCSSKQRKQKLRNEAKYIVQKLKDMLGILRKESSDKDWFIPDDCENFWETEIKSTESSGAICTIRMYRGGEIVDSSSSSQSEIVPIVVENQSQSRISIDQQIDRYQGSLIARIEEETMSNEQDLFENGSIDDNQGLELGSRLNDSASVEDQLPTVVKVNQIELQKEIVIDCGDESRSHHSKSINFIEQVDGINEQITQMMQRAVNMTNAVRQHKRLNQLSLSTISNFSASISADGLGNAQKDQAESVEHQAPIIVDPSSFLKAKKISNEPKIQLQSPSYQSSLQIYDQQKNIQSRKPQSSTSIELQHQPVPQLKFIIIPQEQKPDDPLANKSVLPKLEQQTQPQSRQSQRFSVIGAEGKEGEGEGCFKSSIASQNDLSDVLCYRSSLGANNYSESEDKGVFGTSRQAAQLGRLGQQLPGRLTIPAKKPRVNFSQASEEQPPFHQQNNLFNSYRGSFAQQSEEQQISPQKMADNFQK